MARKKNEFTPPGDEFTPPGEEFARPGEEFRPPEREMAPCCSQYAVPPAEYAPVPGLGLWGGDGKKRHKWRFLLYVAAMVLFLFIVFILPKLSGETPLPTGGPVLSGEPTPAPGSEPTPTASPEPTPEPTPEPEPEPECKPVFVVFSSALKARLVFTKPERFQSVSVELYDRFSETVLDEWEVDLEEIDEDGEYHLPIMDIFTYWSSHPELYGEEMENLPIPVLRTAYVYTDDDGNEVEGGDEVTPAHMLGYGGNYVENEGDYWGKGDADSFVLATWENADPIRIVVNGDPETEEATLFVTAEVGGVRIEAEDCSVLYTVEHFEFDGEYYSYTYTEEYTGGDVEVGEDEMVYYYATLSMHRPKDAPEPGQGGKAHITVVQPVEGMDYDWVDEIELEY